MAMEWPTLTAPSQYFTSTVSCSCPDYLYRRMRLGHACKHMQALRQAVALIASNRAKWLEREATD